MRKISEILRMRHELNRSHREIARGLGISSSTVGDCLARARIASVQWPLPDGLDEQALYDRLYLPVEGSQKIRPLPDWEWVSIELRKKAVTMRLLWKEYREAQPEGVCYTQFCGRYRAYKKQISPVMCQVHKAGEKAFVDYAGMTVSWIDPLTGAINEAQIFVGSLGASQFTFAEASASQQLPDWVQSNVRMWEYFGGVSKIVVPDNLKSAVTKTHRYDPDINKNYQRLGEHYGCAIVPARPAKPKDKGKVENAVGCVERQILAALRHCTFTSIGEINQAIKPLLENFNNQPFQKMKTSRRELYETLDKPSLQPLPGKFQYDQWIKSRVSIDYHIIFENNLYSVPHQYIHHKIDIRITIETVECFYQSKRIAVHARQHGWRKYSTVHEHMPIAHQEQTQWTPERMKNWAATIGPNAKEFIECMMVSRSFPEQAYRACLGVLRLGKSFGDDRLEKACGIGLEAGLTRYKQIESILKNRMDTIPAKQPIINPVISEHENIRGSDYYS